MSITVSIDLGYEFDVKAPFKEVFALLADVPASASHFPGLDKLVDMGDGIYRWEMQKIGLPQISLQTVYASRYVSKQAKGSVVWTPVKGIGNAQVAGNWKVVDKKTFTHLELRIDGELDIALPSLMQAIVAPTVEAEFERMVEQYIDKLIERFGGEV